MRTSRTSGAGLALRQFASSPATTSVLVLVVLVVAFAATITPRALDTLFTAGIRYELDGLSVVQRDLSATSVGGPRVGAADVAGSTGLPPATEAVWGHEIDLLEGMRAGMPDALRGSVGPAGITVVFDALNAPSAPGTPGATSRFRLGFDPRIEDHVRIVEGAMPQALGSPWPGDEAVEVVLAVPAAERLYWSVGEERELVGGDEEPNRVRLVGTFEAVDPSDDFWAHTPGVKEPLIEDTGLSEIVTGTGLAAPESWQQLRLGNLVPHLSAWFPLDGSRVTAAGTGDLVLGIREFTRVAQRNGEPGAGDVFLDFRDVPVPAVDTLAFSSRVLGTIEEQQTRTTAIATVVGMVAVGPLGTAAVVLGLSVRLLLDRRGEAIAIARARGASRSRVRLTLAIEAWVASVAAALAGAVLGALALGGTPSLRELAIALAVATVPAVLAATLPTGLRRRDDVDGRVDRKRRIVEVAIIGSAIAAVVLLLQRGVTAGEVVLLDPLLIATPLLLTLAASVIALWVAPLGLRALVAGTRRRSGLTGFLGAARALRDQVAGLAPVLAMIVAVSVTVFSAVLLSSTHVGISEAGAEAVGADLAVEGAGIDEETAGLVSTIGGVAAVTIVSVQDNGTVVDGGTELGTAIVVADTAALSDVQREQRTGLPSGLGLTETSGGAVPVLVSPAILEAVDGRTRLVLDGEDLEIVGELPSSTAYSARQAVVLADAAFADVMLDTRGAASQVLVRVDGDRGTIADALRSELPEGLTVATRDEATALIQDNPAGWGLTAALLIAIALAAVLCTIGLAITLILGATRRAALATVLRPMGGSAAQSRALLAWEVLPVAVTALLVGLILGSALPTVVAAGVDLRLFTGGATPPVISADPAVLGLVALGFAIVVSTASLVAGIALTRSENHERA